ncbi:MAG: hypothetical protein KME22_01140 [Hassallia sp. WJT32-NPBG1]|nr:hypothetical protein [Hassallia sp. WJT32-NPBG1]
MKIELSVLSRQCLERRIGDRSQLELEITTWEKQRNSQQASVNWRFQTTDARRKMERLYPTI